VESALTTIDPYAGRVSSDVAAVLRTPFDQPRGEVAGVSGLPMWGGKVQGYEHHRKLQAPQRRLRTYRRMLRTSPALLSATLLIRAWMLGVTLRVERGPNTSEEAAEHLEEAFGLGEGQGSGRCRMSASEMLAGLFWARPFGFAVLSEETEHEDGRYWLRALHIRQQSTIAGWIADPRGRLAAVVQHFHAPELAEYLHTLPLNETVVHTQLAEEGGFEGVGLLRACVPHWEANQDAYRQEHVARQRYATPTPVATLDPEMLKAYGFNTADKVRAEVDRLDALLAKYVGHERARLVLPPWVVLSTFGGDKKTFDPEPLLKSASHHERVMAEVFLTAHMMLGRAGGSGTYNLGVMQERVAYQANHDAVSSMVTALNRGPVVRNLHYNFGEKLKPSERPWLAFEGLRDKGFVERATDIVAASGAGLFTPTDLDEQAFREHYDLPPLPDEAKRSTFDRTRQKPGATEAGQRQRRARTPAASLVDRSQRGQLANSTPDNEDAA